MDAIYCKSSEKKCLNLFEVYSRNHHYFSSWSPEEPKSAYDVDAVSIDGRKVKIELKYRNMPVDRFDSYFIEADKLADGLLYYVYDNAKPLYLNFFSDGKTALWDLTNLKKRPEKRKIRRENPGSGMNDNMPTYALSIEDARVSTL